MIRSKLLLPLAWIHAAILWIRHGLYNRNILTSHEGALPTIALGNLTAGGTGKTPLTERLVRDLESILGRKSVGVLSRGYGRKTKGFLWVSPESHYEESGDEPLMLSRKMPEVPIAVCEDRIEGIRRMHAERPDLKWVILDDALQHRRLRPALSVLILDATQPVGNDQLIPAGRLRDLPSRWQNADALIISRLDPTSSPADLKTQLQSHGIDSADHLPVFASSMQPEPLRSWPSGESVGNGDPHQSPDRRERILAVAGIARPDRFMDGLAQRFQLVRRESLADHCHFSIKDYKRWKRIIESDRLQAMVTTEKDAVRIQPGALSSVDVRYESLSAHWHEPDAFKEWISKHPLFVSAKNEDI